jgi:enoyl-CoA hydratase
MHERESHGAVSLLRMAHGKANTLDLEFLRRLSALLEQEELETSRAVVLTGRGSIFSAGVDLTRLLAGGETYVREFLPELEQCLERFFLFKKPLVAAINGHAIAGGCLIACACDHRIVARSELKMGAPEWKVGVPFPAVALEILIHALAGPARDEIVYGGAYFGVQECLRLGLANEAVEPGELLECAIARAEALASIPSQSFALNKRMLRQASVDRLERHAERLRGGVVEAWCSDGVRQSIENYVGRVLRKS